MEQSVVRITNINLNRIKLKDCFISIMFVLLLFLPCFENWFTFSFVSTAFKHFDEVLVLLLIFYCAFHFKTIQRKKPKTIKYWILFWGTGLISTIIFRYQGLMPSLIDGIVIVNRFIVGYLSVIIYCSRKGTQRIVKKLYPITKFIIVILFLLAIHDILFTPFFPKGDYRYFMYSLILMFPHQTYLSVAAVTLLIVASFNQKKKKDLIFMFMASFLCVASLRGKAIAFIFGFWFIYLVFFVMKYKPSRKHIKLAAALMVVLVLFAGRSQIQQYFFTTSYSPRLVMLRDSIKLCLSRFPFGTGFGTFGSTIAAQYYSPLYTTLGYENNWGMSPDFTGFLTDNCWPMIIAQFGIFGLLFFVLFLICLIKTVVKGTKKNFKYGFCLMMILLYLFIVSAAETSFFNPTSLLLAMLFGFIECEVFLKDEKNIVHTA